MNARTCSGVGTGGIYADYCVTINHIDSLDRGSRIEAFLPFTCEEVKSNLPLSANKLTSSAASFWLVSQKTLLFPFR